MRNFLLRHFSKYPTILQNLQRLFTAVQFFMWSGVKFDSPHLKHSRKFEFSIPYTGSVFTFLGVSVVCRVYDFCRFTPSSNAIANSSACSGSRGSVHSFSCTFLLFMCNMNKSSTNKSQKSHKAAKPLNVCQNC